MVNTKEKSISEYFGGVSDKAGKRKRKANSSPLIIKHKMHKKEAEMEKEKGQICKCMNLIEDYIIKNGKPVLEEFLKRIKALEKKLDKKTKKLDDQIFGYQMENIILSNRLNKDYTEMKVMIESNKKKLEENEKRIKILEEMETRLTKKQNNMEIDINNNEDKQSAQAEWVKERKLREKIRNNIIIKGVREGREPNVKEVESLLNNMLKINIKIESFWILSRRDNIFTIGAACRNYEHKNIIMKNKYKLAGSKIYIENEYTHVQKRNNWIVYNKFKEVRTNGVKGRIFRNKIVMDNSDVLVWSEKQNNWFRRRQAQSSQ